MFTLSHIPVKRSLITHCFFPPIRLASIVATCALLTGRNADAAGTHTWTGIGAGRNWSTGLNWDTPLNNDGADDLIFGASTKLNPRANSVAGSGWDVNSVTFSVLAGGNSAGYVISGLNTDEILVEALAGVGVVNNSSVLQTINTRLTLGSSQSFDALGGDLLLGTIGLGSFNLALGQGGAARTITLGDVISGSGAVIKNGAGTVLVSGANTFAGGVTVNQGTLSLANDIGAGSGNIRLNGGTLQSAGTRAIANNVLVGGGVFGGVDNLTLSGVVSGASPLVKNGSGSLILANANSITGPVSVNSGRLVLAANRALGSVSSLNLSGGRLVLGGSGGDLVNNAAAISMNGGIIDANNFTEQFGNLTLGSGNNLINLLADNSSGLLTFANISLTAGATLTIAGWTGTTQSSGTDDRIFVSTLLTPTVLNAISFSGFVPGAFQLAGGEVVPVPEPSMLALLSLGGLGLLAAVRRKQEA